MYPHSPTDPLLTLIAVLIDSAKISSLSSQNILLCLSVCLCTVCLYACVQYVCMPVYSMSVCLCVRMSVCIPVVRCTESTCLPSFSVSGIPIIQNFWAEDNTCARASNSHMTGGMYLINGGILMVPCQGLYHVYAQIRLRDASTPNDNPITIALTKVCLNASTSHPAVILEKYVMPSSYGGYPSLAGTFNMSCGCGFALSTMLFSQVRVSANGPSSFLGAFLVDAATPDHNGSRR